MKEKVKMLRTLLKKESTCWLCHPEGQRRISHAGQLDPSLTLRMAWGNRFVSSCLIHILNVQTLN